MRKLKEIKWEINEDGCHICTSHAKDKDGYPKIKRGQKQYRLSRFIYEQNNEPIPKGMIIMHKCDNPNCINPEHLVLGTYLDNMKDMRKKRRDRYLVGESVYCSKLKESEVIEIIKSKLSLCELSAKFNLSKKYITSIQKGHKWKYLFRNGIVSKVPSKTKKLSDADIEEIRNIKNLSCHKIAKLYSVSYQWISRIRRNEVRSDN